jgi:hypothetical protein
MSNFDYFVLFLSVCVFWGMIHITVLIHEIKRDVNLIIFQQKLAWLKETNNGI